MTVMGGVGAVLVDNAVSVDHVPSDPIFVRREKRDASYRDVAAWANRLDATDKRVGGPVIIGDAYAQMLGAEARFVGAIGRDPDGQLVKEFMARHHLSTRWLQEGPGGTATTLLLVDSEGGRTILVSQNPNTLASPTSEQAQRFADEIDALHIDGREVDAAYELGEAARNQGKPVLYDVGNWKPHSAKLFDVATIVQFPLRSAVACLGTGADDLDMATAAQEISRRDGIPLVVITDGEHGYASSENGRPGITVPAYDIGVAVDSNGAGDVFGAVTLLKVAQRWPARRALEFASATAAMSCMESGHEKLLAEGAGLTEAAVLQFQTEHSRPSGYLTLP